MIHIVDDDPGVRRSLKRLLDVSGMNAEAHASAQEFLDRVAGDSEGCVILDYEMPGMSGLDLQAILDVRGGNWQVVFITGRADIPTSVRAMKGGAVDFLVKPAERAEILGAVGHALDRLRSVSAERAQSGDIASRLEALTPRERQVMGYVIAGRLNKQIADTLGTAEKTVKIQRARVMRKMGVRSVAELVRLTEKAGVAPSEPEPQTL